MILLALLFSQFAQTTYAADAVTSFSITRMLGANGDFGKATTEMNCVSDSAICTVTKTSQDEKIESKKISHKKGMQIASEFLKHMKDLKESANKEGLQWALHFDGKDYNGIVSNQPDEKDRSLLYLMKAEADLAGASK